MHADTPQESDDSSVLTVGLLAGETSGDILGAGLISEVKERFPGAEFVGIGGPLMQREGLRSLHNMDRLSIVGLVEPLKRLPELVKIRSSVVKYFRRNPPDIFIGIDAPDFNLGVERRLKKLGIKTVHYVSPSVWAWREWRIKKIKKAIDHMLCLFPFEKDFYEKHGVPVSFIGHPMADDISLDVDKASAKRSLGVSSEKLLVAILPGSRSKEIAFLGPIFFRVVKVLQEQNQLGEVAIAAASDAAYNRLQKVVTEQGIEARIFLGRAREVLLAADAALAASGTVTLEGMLTKTPMVVAYKMEALSFWIISRMVKQKLNYVALPNILAGRCLMTEHLQENAKVEAIAEDLLDLVNDKSRRESVSESFLAMHKSLRQDASARAADVIAELISSTDGR